MKVGSSGSFEIKAEKSTAERQPHVSVSQVDEWDEYYGQDVSITLNEIPALIEFLQSALKQ